MNEAQNAARSVEPIKGSRQAYRLGLNLQMFFGWARSVEMRRGTVTSFPDYREFPFTAIRNPAFSTLKDRFAARALDSMRILALLHVVDPIALVEMHRICGGLEREFTELVQSFERGDRRGIRKCLRCVMLHQTFSYNAGRRLFVGNWESLEGWYRLGTLLANVVCRLVLGDKQHALPPVMTEFIQCGRELLSEDVLETVVGLYDPKVRYVDISKPAEPGGKLITAILKLDARIRKYLEAPASTEPYVVFDDNNKSINYFGIEIPFADLPAGGLNLMRVLVQDPSKPLTAKQIVEFTDLCVKEFQVPQYLSRFRGALKKAIGDNEELPIQFMPDSNESKLCFIVPDRKARAQDRSLDTYYKLALPPDRVRYIAPK